MIHYGSPYSTEGRLGRAYNAFMAMLPGPTDFGCLIDGDTLFTTPDYGRLIERAVGENTACRLFYARTNRIACPWQRDDTAPAGDDVGLHRGHGERLARLHGASVREVRGEPVPGSGFLILLRKDLWAEAPFKESGLLGVDWDFYRRVVQRGERVLLMTGVYLYHWYRGGKADSVAHLVNA